MGVAGFQEGVCDEGRMSSGGSSSSSGYVISCITNGVRGVAAG